MFFLRNLLYPYSCWGLGCLLSKPVALFPVLQGHLHIPLHLWKVMVRHYMVNVTHAPSLACELSTIQYPICFSMGTQPFQRALEEGAFSVRIQIWVMALVMFLDDLWSGWNGVMHSSLSYLTSWWFLIPSTMVSFRNGSKDWALVGWCCASLPPSFVINSSLWWLGREVLLLVPTLWGTTGFSAFSSFIPLISVLQEMTEVTV